MRLTKEQINSLELRILEEGDPRLGVEAWLESNEEVVRPWVEAAKRVEDA
jgi:ABC-type proline/glycine betaine transport system substrate-binding protein